MQTRPQPGHSGVQVAPGRIKKKWERNDSFLPVTLALLLHTLACLFYFGVAKLHLVITHTPIASATLWFVGGNLQHYFPLVITASVLLTIVHGLAGAFVRWDHELEKLTGADVYELTVMVEIGLQTFQAFKLSRFVATRWINRLIVFVIVANCWLMPIVRAIFRKKTPSFVKVVHLALDAVLKLVYGMFIPLAIFYPYYRDINHILYDQSHVEYYSELWFISAIAENRQIYVSSWLDFFSKIAPGFSLFLRLCELQVREREHKEASKTANSQDNSRVLSSGTFVTEASRKTLVKKRVVSGVMVCWGLAMLMFHIAAYAVESTGKEAGCLLEMRPLGSAQYACAVMEMSCTQRQIVGTKSELDDALSRINPLSIQALIFSHCQALSMPARLKTFRNLIEIKIHNSSIAEWGDDAALTAQNHPTIHLVYMTLTNMSRIPDGLLSPTFPPSLYDIELCGTNLTADGLPLDLVEKWPSMVYFSVELSPGITVFPAALHSASSTFPWISLSSNSITSLPDDLFVTHSFAAMYLSGNPLTSLPEEAGTASVMYILAVAFTEILDVSESWKADKNAQAAATSGFYLAAASTPLCDKLQEEARSTNVGVGSAGGALSPIGSSSEAKVAWLPVDCDQDPSNVLFYYPLKYEMQWREVNRA
ncbi:hypothetical protein Gpo141_00004306 [Globisporangium polare]